MTTCIQAHYFQLHVEIRADSKGFGSENPHSTFVTAMVRGELHHVRIYSAASAEYEY